MRIAQINAQRAMAASANLEILIKELDIDILCIQEPFVYKNAVRGYSSYAYSIVQPGVENPWVAAVIANESVVVFHLAHFDTPHVLCFQVMSEMEEFYIINVYCQFSLQIEPILSDLERIVLRLNSNRVVVTMDANAKSELWYAEETDERGRIVEEFLMLNKLYVANEVSNLPTFQTTNGQSNIDLTLMNESMIGACTGWTVSPMCTTSDHNLIIFSVTTRFIINRRFIKYGCFNVRKANWDVFNNLLNNEFSDDVINEIYNENPEKAVKLFNAKIKKICRKSIPEKKRCNQAVPWWNEKLAKLRRELNIVKKGLTRFKKLRLLNFLEDAKIKYKKIRNKYIAEIRKSKQESWQNFVTVESNKDPWSIPYKIVRDKIKKDEIITSLTLMDGTNTCTWEDTIKSFLSKCAPKDDKTMENEMHGKILATIKEYKNCNVENEITMEEINRAIIKLKNKTAPGTDRFTTEIIKQIWSEKPQIIYYILNNCIKNKIFPRLWKISKLKIILKERNKDKKLLGSYRPISLIPTMSKVFYSNHTFVYKANNYGMVTNRIQIAGIGKSKSVWF